MVGSVGSIARKSRRRVLELKCFRIFRVFPAVLVVVVEVVFGELWSESRRAPSPPRESVWWPGGVPELSCSWVGGEATLVINSPDSFQSLAQHDKSFESCRTTNHHIASTTPLSFASITRAFAMPIYSFYIFDRHCTHRPPPAYLLAPL